MVGSAVGSRCVEVSMMRTASCKALDCRGTDLPGCAASGARQAGVMGVGAVNEEPLNASRLIRQPLQRGGRGHAQPCCAAQSGHTAATRGSEAVWLFHTK
eukprot:353029-Chlamydomonas_euryale.AAC.2